MRLNQNVSSFLQTARNRLYFYSALLFVAIVLLTNFLSLISPGAFRALVSTGFVASALWASVRLASVFGRYVSTHDTVDSANKAVFITGSASGFGYSLAQELDKLGYTVFAGCRVIDDQRAQGLQRSCSDRLTLVKVDVNSDEQVAEAVEFVQERLGGKSLWSVVNNAGIFALEGVDWGKSGVHEYKRLMETNALGAVRVSRAFAPLLRKTKYSRVVITASIAGRIEWPAMAAYSMSKFALRAFGNALRRELRPFEVYVSVLEPDFYSTPLVDESKLLQSLDEKWELTPEAVRRSYSAEQMRTLKDSIKTLLELTHTDPTPVVKAMVSAITCSREPEHFYRLCSVPEALCFYSLEMFPTELIDDYLLGMPLIIACTILRYANSAYDCAESFAMRAFASPKSPLVPAKKTRKGA